MFVIGIDEKKNDIFRFINKITVMPTQKPILRIMYPHESVRFVIGKKKN